VANKEHMLAAAVEVLREEKQWLLNQCGLIPDFDDDVMDEQKWHVLLVIVLITGLLALFF
jgi:hypothetical protein